jgi:granule-bound starch synthase
MKQIKVGDRYEGARLFHCYKRGVDRVFIDHPSFLEKVRFLSLICSGKQMLVAFTSFSEVSASWFQVVWGKTGEKIYGPDTGVDYKDNQMRFSLLCQVTH